MSISMRRVKQTMGSPYYNVVYSTHKERHAYAHRFLLFGEMCYNFKWWDDSHTRYDRTHVKTKGMMTKL